MPPRAISSSKFIVAQVADTRKVANWRLRIGRSELDRFSDSTRRCRLEHLGKQVSERLELSAGYSARYESGVRVSPSCRR